MTESEYDTLLLQCNSEEEKLIVFLDISADDNMDMYSMVRLMDKYPYKKL